MFLNGKGTCGLHGYSLVPSYLTHQASFNLETTTLIFLFKFFFAGLSVVCLYVYYS